MRSTREIGSQVAPDAPGATEPKQTSLFSLLPGAPGGKALRDKRGRTYFQELGRKGGKQTFERYGITHMHELAEHSADKRRRQRYTQPKTIRTWYGTIERRIPYWPARSRRKRPVFVYIEIEEVTL